MTEKPLAFVSYRRDDARDWANLIAETLQRQFGPDAVFIDTDRIRVGDQWNRTIEEALERATVVLSVIGPKWLHLQNPETGQRRLDVPDDWVRREIEVALTSSRPLLPLIVAGATLPTSRALPTSITALHERQAFKIEDRHDIDIVVTEFANRLGFRRIETELDFPTPVDRAPELNDAEIAEALKRLPGWEIEKRDSKRGKDGIAIELVTTLKFRSFEDAIHYMAAAARYISRTDHHPFWENQYKDLRIRLSTWDIGLRIAAKDIKLADYLLWLYRDYIPGEQPAGPASPSA